MTRNFGRDFDPDEKDEREEEDTGTSTEELEDNVLAGIYGEDES
jgi:hypothetical protein